MTCGFNHVFILYFLMTYAVQNTVYCLVTNSNDTEVDELRAMLQSAFGQIRHLRQENNRRKIIWTSLGNMCSSLGFVTCNCNGPSTKVYEPTANASVTKSGGYSTPNVTEENSKYITAKVNMGSPLETTATDAVNTTPRSDGYHKQRHVRTSLTKDSVTIYINKPNIVNIPEKDDDAFARHLINFSRTVIRVNEEGKVSVNKEYKYGYKQRKEDPTETVIYINNRQIDSTLRNTNVKRCGTHKTVIYVNHPGGDPHSNIKDLDGINTVTPTKHADKYGDGFIITPTVRSDFVHNTTSSQGLKTPVTRNTTLSTRTTTPRIRYKFTRTRTTTPRIRHTTPSTRTTTPRIRHTSRSTRTTTPRIRYTFTSTRTTTPRIRHTTPSTRTTTPRIRHTTPRTRTLTPRIRLTTPRKRTTTPRIRHATPSTRTTTPGIRHTTPGTRTSTPRIRLTTPRKRNTTPSIRLTTPRKRYTTRMIRYTTPSMRYTTRRIRHKTPSTRTTTRRIRHTTPSTRTTTPSTRYITVRTRRTTYSRRYTTSRKRQTTRFKLIPNMITPRIGWGVHHFIGDSEYVATRKPVVYSNTLLGRGNGFFDMTNRINGKNGEIAAKSTNRYTIKNTKKCNDTDPVLKLISVTSGGLEADNSVSVAIRYTAPKQHTTEWIVPRKNYGTYRSSGVRGNRTIGQCLFDYKSSIIVIYLKEVKHVVFRIYTEDRIMSVHFNILGIRFAGTQLIPSTNITIGELNKVYTGPRDTDMKITVLSTSEKHGYIGHVAVADIYFTGLNSSTNPASPFEIRMTKNFTLRPVSDRSTYIDITLEKQYVHNGGILTIRLSQRVGGKIIKFTHGYSAKIISPVTDEVVPYNTIGVYPLPRQTAIVPPSQNIVCAALGNPWPTVSILKTHGNGNLSKMETETVIVGSVMNVKVLNIYTNQSSAVEGHYVCRAENGMTRVETITEAILMVPVTFNDDNTGIVFNQTNRVVITCEASGSPLPKLEMRLYFTSGPDLIKSGMFKVSKTIQIKNTIRVTLSMTSVDRDVHTVYCAALQKGIFRETDSYRMIEMFPGTRPSYNFEFYNRVQQMVYLNN